MKKNKQLFNTKKDRKNKRATRTFEERVKEELWNVEYINKSFDISKIDKEYIDLSGVSRQINGKGVFTAPFYSNVYFFVYKKDIIDKNIYLENIDSEKLLIKVNMFNGKIKILKEEEILKLDSNKLEVLRNEELKKYLGKSVYNIAILNRINISEVKDVFLGEEKKVDYIIIDGENFCFDMRGNKYNLNKGDIFLLNDLREFYGRPIFLDEDKFIHKKLISKMWHFPKWFLEEVRKHS